MGTLPHVPCHALYPELGLLRQPVQPCGYWLWQNGAVHRPCGAQQFALSNYIYVLKEEIHKQASVDSKHLLIPHLAFLLMDVNRAVGKPFVFLERSV